MAAKRFGKPIRRASAERRTYNGRTYASLLERMYAEHLDLLVRCNAIVYWTPQVTFLLGPDNKFRVDFYCFSRSLSCMVSHAVDVKGYPQVGWTTKRDLWIKYAPVRLHVIERKRRSWVTTETIVPAMEDAQTDV